MPLAMPYTLCQLGQTWLENNQKKICGTARIWPGARAFSMVPFSLWLVGRGLVIEVGNINIFMLVSYVCNFHIVREKRD